MTGAHLADNEKERLAALHAYQILDTPPEREFDELAALAASVCETPMALVSLVDADRQWFKAKVGTEESETPREVSFCAHAIRQRDLFIIYDAKQDQRFADNPLVTGEPHIRFYAGMPLVTAGGHAIGTLCVLDREPRRLGQQQEQSLRALGLQVVSQLELRKTKSDLIQTITMSRETEKALRASEQFKTRLIDGSQDCIKVLDLDGRLLSINAGGMQTLEICDFRPMKDSLWVEFWQGADREAAEAAVVAARGGGVGRFIGFCPTMAGKPRWWDVMVNPVVDADGRPERLLALSRDVTAYKRAELMLRAIIDATASVTGKDFFYSLARHLASALGVRFVFVSECSNAARTRARLCAFWNGDRFVDNFEYDLNLTPCVEVVGEDKPVFYKRDVPRYYPAEGEFGIESYLGVPIHDSAGGVIGILAVLDDKPMEETQLEVSVLKVFAARAGAELERLKAEEELRAALAEVRSLRDRLQAENVYLQEEIRQQHNFEEIVGNSPALLGVFETVRRVAPTDATVLILGETGTGKELIARAIHDRSGRRDRPLVKVNCGAISAGLVESELFGHVKGAFTGALEKRTGRFELADGGTLFLDEVGELPLETQVKLLRALQEGEFEPVGSSKTVRVNVRIIAATNRNLEEEVRAGRFRADLFYRLNVLPLHVPPLRERREDIQPLTMFFLSRYARQFGRQMTGVAQQTMARLINYAWPGNIRELQNLVERGVVLAQGHVLTLDRALLPDASLADASLPDPSLSDAAAAGANAAAPMSSVPSANYRRQATAAPPAQSPPALEDVERQHILAVLEQSRWVIEGERGAAKTLNLHPNTLRSRMKKLGIRRPSH